MKPCSYSNFDFKIFIVNKAFCFNMLTKVATIFLNIFLSLIPPFFERVGPQNKKNQIWCDLQIIITIDCANFNTQF